MKQNIPVSFCSWRKCSGLKVKENHSREVKLKIKLPRCGAGRIVSIFVHEGEAELDDLQEVDVAPEQLVLVVHCAAELADGPDHHSRKLCVLVNTNNMTSVSQNKRNRIFLWKTCEPVLKTSITAMATMGFHIP